MLELNIPNYAALQIDNLVCDFNGTLAVDGALLPGVREALNGTAQKVAVHVVTADTFGQARQQLEGIDCTLTVLPEGNQAVAKQKLIQELGAERTIAVGNGRNDRLMLAEAAVGIAVLLEEGAACQTILEADVLVTSIDSAFAFFEKPRRLVATLRA